jgi:hypothetical protein
MMFVFKGTPALFSPPVSLLQLLYLYSSGFRTSGKHKL